MNEPIEGCIGCAGTGGRMGCAAHGGQYYYTTYYKQPFKCPVCFGMKYNSFNSLPCNVCDGTGVIWR